MLKNIYVFSFIKETEKYLNDILYFIVLYISNKLIWMDALTTLYNNLLFLFYKLVILSFL